MRNFTQNSIKNSNFGSYHPIVVILYFVVILGIIMTTTSPDILVVSLIGGLIYSAMLKGINGLRNNLIIMLVVIIFTTVINTFFTHDGETVLFYYNANRITLEAIVYGLFSGLLISTVIIWFSCINVIITGEMIRYLFTKVSPKLGLMISMILRYIPLFKDRFSEISVSQKAIGKESQNGILAKGRLFVKKISILISWSLEGSIESADAMSARGYGLKGRTSFITYKFEFRDIIGTSILIITTILGIYFIISAQDKMLFYPKLIIPKLHIESLIKNICVVVLALMPVVIDIIGEIKWKKLKSSN